MPGLELLPLPSAPTEESTELSECAPACTCLHAHTNAQRSKYMHKRGHRPTCFRGKGSFEILTIVSLTTDRLTVPQAHEPRSPVRTVARAAAAPTIACAATAAAGGGRSRCQADCSECQAECAGVGPCSSLQECTIVPCLCLTCTRTRTWHCNYAHPLQRCLRSA